MPENKALYIVFEGGEGSGKSTQSRLLAQKIGATLTHEPGGTKTGQRLREILLSPEIEGIDSSTELLLMAADRHQTMSEVVTPALKQGQPVISDRSFISSLAYQGAGRGFGMEAVLDMNLRLGRLKMPDLLFILHPPSSEELSARMSRKGRLDKIEAVQDNFHKRVAEAFGQMANTLASDSRTQSITTIEISQEDADGLRTVEAIQEDIFNNLTSYCQEQMITAPKAASPLA